MPGQPPQAPGAWPGQQGWPNWQPTYPRAPQSGIPQQYSPHQQPPQFTPQLPVPQQWMPPGMLPPGMFPPGWDPVAQAALRRKRRKRGWIIASIMVVVLALVGGLAAVGVNIQRDKAAKAQTAYDLAHKGSWPDAQKVLTNQSAALLRGDEKGWLAAVDPGQPKLQTYYKQLYTALHSLKVNGWHYYPATSAPFTTEGTPAIDLPVNVAYCLAATACLDKDPTDSKYEDQVARIKQQIKLDRVDKVYKIVSVSQENNDKKPWQATALTYKAGKRVVVGAPGSLKSQLPEVAVQAEAAARVADHFAAYTGHKPGAYDVFLAGRTEWSAWYGGKEPEWAVGYAIPTGTQGTDVVLRMSSLQDLDELRVTIQHEFGHVVTLGGTDQSADSGYVEDDEWLVEGVADYIGQWPMPAKNSPRIGPLRAAGNIPTDIRVLGLNSDSSDQDADRLYGYGYLAVSCMATKYGEARMMKFVDFVLRDHKSVEASAPPALGHSLTQVNQTCSAYFRQLLS